MAILIIKQLFNLSSMAEGIGKIFKTAINIQLGPDYTPFKQYQNKTWDGNSDPGIPSPSKGYPSRGCQPSHSANVSGWVNQRRSLSTSPAIHNQSNNGILDENVIKPPRKASDSSPEASSMNPMQHAAIELHSDTPTESPSPLRVSRVPSSRLGRLFHYGGLVAGIGWGTASEALKRTTSFNQQIDHHPASLSQANVRRLVDKLTKMRGAALKLGQFLAIQDAKILPPQIEEIFVKVQCTADYMPFSQAQDVLKGALGNNWREKFTQFTEVPVAAASIGQMHTATVTEGEKESIKAAVKIQFPGVYHSIQADLSYLSLLAGAYLILPKGLFLSKSIETLGEELKQECDYLREAHYGKLMRKLLEDDSRFRVPRVFDHLSTKMVLTTEFMAGTPLRHAAKWSQDLRNKIGNDLLELCFREILQFRVMQTDPNWSNFLWNESNHQIELIDFGATREYSESFIKGYMKLLKAGIEGTRAECIEESIKLGYLTANECEAMLEAQYKTVKALCEPFQSTIQQPFDFSNQTVTDRVRAEIPTMVRLRLKPPPTETYSLNRKLSGIFLLCTRLGAQIDCHKILQKLIPSSS